MSVYYCDICHTMLDEKESVYKLYRAVGHNQFNLDFGESINLCDKCSDDFDDWQDGKKVMRNNTE